MYFTSLFIEQIEFKINKAGKILSKWLKQNQMKMNKNKTVSSIIHDQRKTNIRNKCKIVIHGVKIEEVKQVKYLGIIIDDDLTFRENSVSTVGKIGRELNIFYRLNNSVSSYTKSIIYKSIISPDFEYCSTLMLNYNQSK